MAVVVTPVGARAQIGAASDEERVTSLLQSGNVGFDATLEGGFRGLRGVQGFQSVEPLLAILKNETMHAVKAYVIQWAITRQDGSTTSASLTVMLEPMAQPEFAGQADVLKPNETQLVSPFFNWSASRFATLLRIGIVEIVLQVDLTSPLTAEVQGARNIQVSVDGVVFDDGLFAGPNTLQLYERFEAEQQGDRDEGAAVLSQLNEGADSLQVETMLISDIKKGSATSGTGIRGFYLHARGSEARRLVETFNSMGETPLRERALMLANSKPLHLRHQTFQ